MAASLEAAQEDSQAKPGEGLTPGQLDENAPWHRKLEERAARWFTQTRMPILAQQRDQAVAAVRGIPGRLQRLTNQTSLVLELVDDFHARRYRDVSWLTIAIATGAILYCVSPADAIPDFLPIVGVVDEAVVLAAATRAIRGDLIRYAKFKGYDVADYFG